MKRAPVTYRAFVLCIALWLVAATTSVDVSAVQGTTDGLAGTYSGAAAHEFPVCVPGTVFPRSFNGELIDIGSGSFRGQFREVRDPEQWQINDVSGSLSSNGTVEGTAIIRYEGVHPPDFLGQQAVFVGTFSGDSLNVVVDGERVTVGATDYCAVRFTLTLTRTGGNCVVGESVDRVVNFNEDGGSQTVTIEVLTDTCEWTATPEFVENVGWFTVTPSSGTGDGPVTINVQPLPPGGGNRECEVRSGNIRVVSGSDSERIGIRQGDWSPRCSICPALLATKLVPGDAGSLHDMRRFRDEIFARTPRGRKYTRLYYEHSAEAEAILVSNPWLLVRAARLLDRHAHAVRSSIDGGQATVIDADLDELDAFVADVAASGSPALRSAVNEVRRDLRNPEILSENGLEVRVAGPSESKRALSDVALSDDPLFTAFAGLGSLRAPEILAAAAHSRAYARASREQAGEVLTLLASNPILALRAPAAFGHVKSALESVVRTGGASMDASARDDLDAFLGGLERHAGRELGRAIRLLRRDLASPRGLEGLGVRTQPVPVASPRAHGLARPRGTGSTLDYATYFGGGEFDYSNQIALDSAGNIYLTGTTSATDFPTLNGAQSVYGGGESDAFVVKLDPTGSTVLFASYLGGSGEDVGAGIAVDAAGAVYVVGMTTSTNFPIAGAAVRRTLGGSRDGFLAKLNTAGSSLTLSTYLGGSDEDTATGVAVSGKNVYVTGITTSADFPAVKGLRRTLQGSTDAFVMKLKKGGAKIAYSSFFGGSGLEVSSSIAVDSAGNAYIAGVTSSADMPTAQAAQPTFGGIYDGFVAKLNAKGTALVYATYLGGTDIDGCTGIAVDATGNTYLSGVTASTDLPVATAFQPSYGGGVLDGFVAKVRADGAAFSYASYLGGSDEDRAFRIAVDPAGRLTVAGLTASSNFPTRVAQQGQLAGGGTDAFVTTFEASGSSLVSSTYLGGSGGDGGTAVALGADGLIWVAGETVSTDFPVVGPLQEANRGASDLFIVRFKED